MTFIRSSALLKPKFLVTTHTSKQETSNTGGVRTVIDGSEISYEPHAGSDKVSYEISFYASNNNITTNGECFQFLQLEEYSGSTWSEMNAIYRKNFGSSVSNSAQYNRFLIHLKFILPAWSGSKQLRLTIGSNDSGEKIELHEVQSWDGAWTYENYFNTNLLVYSI